jgi:hypothetical protein
VKGKGNDPGNNRGIALLPVLSKLFSRTVTARLGEWLSNNRVLNRFQAGFIRDKRMINSVFIIRTTVDRYPRCKQGCICWCFVDLENT